ncbi:transposase zinc-binding domain-containing protein [Sorangium sp. So ce1182]|uniref:transposase zinc-binding domain-containing protein n=1 Tax=Sorangium sp. So ce1182 TaxID=3133334 RepID=UPI003F617A27
MSDSGCAGFGHAARGATNTRGLHYFRRSLRPGIQLRPPQSGGGVKRDHYLVRGRGRSCTTAGRLGGPLSELVHRSLSIAVRIPKHAKKELEAYLDCGLLCRGFARLRGERCEEGRLVAFSCKGRGFCPSCLADACVPRRRT